jgi:8-oxo-dGTP pyrophosphatase MutT (NUDIX family)
VLLLRGGSGHDDRGLEVLLGRRTEAARFMAGVWVFPGGAVDDGGTSEQAVRETALRELEEEVGVRIADAAALVPFSRWITPAAVKRRFDTWFFLARAPSHCRPEPDGDEITDAAWFTPADALARGAAGELRLVFPTIKQLEDLAQFATADEALAGAASRDVQPILPKVVGTRENAQVLLPGEPGDPEG